jgi:nitroreductase
MVAAAIAAPDHGGHRPWRFIHVDDASRGLLGDLFAAGARIQDGGADPGEVERQRQKALAAPTLLVACARLDHDDPKVPVSEQLVSAGAGVGYLLLAAHAMGYGAMILSGRKTRDPTVRAGLGLAADEEIIGFIHIGTECEAAAPKPRPPANEFLRGWDGGGARRDQSPAAEAPVSIPVVGHS